MAPAQDRAPKNLLEREIFASSLTTSQWFEKKHRFTKSLAASSATGYVMGLGDRHPNNLMIDLKSGEIVHIDYGVIFDNGKNLTVPEVVPFRLTQSLITAMGVWGIWGDFHKCMASTLKTMKDNRAVILTLFEAFVHDPVVGKSVVLGDNDKNKEKDKDKDKELSSSETDKTMQEAFQKLKLHATDETASSSHYDDESSYNDSASETSSTPRSRSNSTTNPPNNKSKLKTPKEISKHAKSVANAKKEKDLAAVKKISSKLGVFIQSLELKTALCEDKRVSE